MIRAEKTNKIQSTNTVVMVPPSAFGFNSQTAVDNEFQIKTDLKPSEISERAMLEYGNMVQIMRNSGIRVLELSPPDSGKGKAPDAVFPNNWFSTNSDGDLIIYPMAAKNRRIEIRPEELIELLKLHDYTIGSLHRISGVGTFLEGTGSLVFDHLNRRIFAAESLRCNAQLFNDYLEKFRYEGIIFKTLSSHSKPIYHTNVLMSVGMHFAVVCLDAIALQADRLLVKSALSDRDLIEISINQMEEYFCGNIIELSSGSGKSLILMSERALSGFTSKQLAILGKYGAILPVSIPTIESIGGGSARCMVAEIFLPRV